MGSWTNPDIVRALTYKARFPPKDEELATDVVSFVGLASGLIPEVFVYDVD